MPRNWWSHVCSIHFWFFHLETRALSDWLIIFFFWVFNFLERKWEISYYCSSNTIQFQYFDILSSSCANYISYNVSVLILWQLPPDDWKYTNFWHYSIIVLILLFFFIKNSCTYSNLPNNSVGPFNRVGGRLLRN